MPTSLRRCLSDVSMIIVRATNSGERAWREEYLKYVLKWSPSPPHTKLQKSPSNHKFISFISIRVVKIPANCFYLLTQLSYLYTLLATLLQIAYQSINGSFVWRQYAHNSYFMHFTRHSLHNRPLNFSGIFPQHFMISFSFSSIWARENISHQLDLVDVHSHRYRFQWTYHTASEKGDVNWKQIFNFVVKFWRSITICKQQYPSSGHMKKEFF